MRVNIYRDQAAFDAGCFRTGDVRDDGAPIWADYEPGEIPDCAGCDAEAVVWPIVALSLPTLHERIMLEPHAARELLALLGSAVAQLDDAAL